MKGSHAPDLAAIGSGVRTFLTLSHSLSHSGTLSPCRPPLPHLLFLILSLPPKTFSFQSLFRIHLYTDRSTFLATTPPFPVSPSAPRPPPPPIPPPPPAGAQIAVSSSSEFGALPGGPVPSESPTNSLYLHGQTPTLGGGFKRGPPPPTISAPYPATPPSTPTAPLSRDVALLVAAAVDAIRAAHTETATLLAEARAAVPSALAATPTGLPVLRGLATDLPDALTRIALDPVLAPGGILDALASALRALLSQGPRGVAPGRSRSSSPAAQVVLDATATAAALRQEAFTLRVAGHTACKALLKAAQSAFHPEGANGTPPGGYEVFALVGDFRATVDDFAAQVDEACTEVIDAVRAEAERKEAEGGGDAGGRDLKIIRPASARGPNRVVRSPPSAGPARPATAIEKDMTKTTKKKDEKENLRPVMPPPPRNRHWRAPGASRSVRRRPKRRSGPRRRRPRRRPPARTPPCPP